MQKLRFIHWQVEEMWLGYLEEYPDYWTQATTLEELKAHLRDLYQDLTSGQIPSVRRAGELEVA